MSHRSDGGGRGRGTGDRGRTGERAGRAAKGGSSRNEAGPEGKKPFGPRRAATGEAERENKSFRPHPARKDDASGEGGGRRFDKPRKAFAAKGESKSGFRREAGDDRPPRKAPSGGRFDRKPPVAAPDEAEGGGAVRIAKRLARAGIASRRDAEAMIVDGRVRLNGQVVATPAITVRPSDRIEIDGEALPATERTRLWLYHKPLGLVTTNRDPEGRPTVFDRLPEDLPRVLTVGRLDINTEGLLLLTNDGGLARTLELPSTGWLRRYRVRAHGAIAQKQLDELKHGIAVDGVFYGAIEAVLDSEKGSNVWMTLGLREGKNREVKRILGHLGLDVNRLIRISFGPFQLGDLPEGAVREIRGRTLRDQLGATLIEESGADFDAPVVNPFTNDVVEAAPQRRENAEPRREEARPERSEWVTAKGDGKPAGKPNRREFGNAKRESALARLDTRPDRPPRRERDGGDAPRFSKRDGGPKRFSRGEAPAADERPARPKPGARRSANVWIAPGGRPLSERQAAARRERDERRAAEGDAKPLRSRAFRDRPDGASRTDDGERPRRSAGIRNQSAGASFGNKAERKGSFGERGDRPGGNDRPPRPEGGKTGRPFGGSRKPPGGGGGGRRPPRGGT